jgi:hypothetical protein
MVRESVIELWVLQNEGKAMSLHAMEALEGRGGIAPTHY